MRSELDDHLVSPFSWHNCSIISYQWPPEVENRVPPIERLNNSFSQFDVVGQDGLNGNPVLFDRAPASDLVLLRGHVLDQTLAFVNSEDYLMGPSSSGEITENTDSRSQQPWRGPE